MNCGIIVSFAVVFQTQALPAFSLPTCTSSHDTAVLYTEHVFQQGKEIISGCALSAISNEGHGSRGMAHENIYETL